MSRYRKVDPRIWNDAKFVALSDQAKLVFFMLLTHPNMTALGAMRATIAGLAEELGWQLEAFREAFREVITKGMAEHDEKGRLIALPKFLRYNEPESPNVVKAWAASADLLPECRLKTVVIQRAKAFVEAKSEAFREAFPQALAKGMANQEQEQEQEQKQEKSLGGAALAGVNSAACAADAAPAATSAKAKKNTNRGTRLPDDWRLPKAWGEWALAEYPQWTADKVRLEADKFADHWRAKAGKDATKRDWEAGWRNWCRSSLAHRDDQRQANAPPAETLYQRSARERVAAFAPGVAAKAPVAQSPHHIHLETIDVAARLVD